jgi:hypothetical protein
MNLNPGDRILYRNDTVLYSAIVLGCPMDVLVLRVDWGDRCSDLGLEWVLGNEDFGRIAPPF